mgnify:CR=1 FL=1|jgi:hypothetical protein
MSHDDSIENSIVKATDESSEDEYSVADRELFSTRAGSLSSRAKFVIEQRSKPSQIIRRNHQKEENDGLLIPTTPTKTMVLKSSVYYPKHSPYYKTDNPVGKKSVMMPCMTEKDKSSPPLFSPDEEVVVGVSSSFTSSFFNSTQYTPSSVKRKDN